MPIQAVIFDMDGVLIDSEGVWKQARIEFAAALGKVWTDADHVACMGVNTIEWAHIMKARLHVETLTVEQVMADIIGRMKQHYQTHLPLLPGAIESVHTAASKYRVGLASGSATDLILFVTRLTGLDKVFEVMVFGDDMAHGKPAPDSYLEAARRLNLPPAQCVAIEDSGNGVRSAHAAGMKVIAVPSPDFPLKPEVEALAHLKLTSLVGFSVETIAGLA